MRGLDRELAEAGLTAETARLAVLVPLVQVAWADGAVQPEERAFVLRVAAGLGLATGPGRAVLEGWLARAPSPAVVAAAHRLVRALGERTEAPSLEPGASDQVLAWCGGVADAAGGLFGYGRVSAAEQAVLDGVAAEFGGGWTLLSDPADDVTLWSRDVPGAALKAFRGVGHARASVEAAVGLLLEPATAREWLFRCDEARLVAREASGELLVYVAVHGIWPVSDRDAVIRVRPELRGDEVHLAGTADAHALPAEASRVRIPALGSSWVVAPAGEGRVRLEWSGHFDPVGPAPAWLVNLASVQVPRHALRRVQALLGSGAEAHAPAGRAVTERLRGAGST